MKSSGFKLLLFVSFLALSVSTSFSQSFLVLGLLGEDEMDVGAVACEVGSGKKYLFTNPIDYLRTSMNMNFLFVKHGNKFCVWSKLGMREVAVPMSERILSSKVNNNGSLYILTEDEKKVITLYQNIVDSKDVTKVWSSTGFKAYRFCIDNKYAYFLKVENKQENIVRINLITFVDDVLYTLDASRSCDFISIEEEKPIISRDGSLVIIDNGKESLYLAKEIYIYDVYGSIAFVNFPEDDTLYLMKGKKVIMMFPPKDGYIYTGWGGITNELFATMYKAGCFVESAK